MAVTDRRATTLWPKHGAARSRDKSWVLAMLAAKRRLRVAPVPPQAADLTRPPRAARTMPGRDEGTGASIEPRNNHEQAFWPCCHHHSSRTVGHPMVGETEQASHTEIRTLPYDVADPENRLIARELEARWDRALKHVEAVEKRIADHDAAALLRVDVDRSASPPLPRTSNLCGLRPQRTLA